MFDSLGLAKLCTKLYIKWAKLYIKWATPSVENHEATAQGAELSSYTSSLPVQCSSPSQLRQYLNASLVLLWKLHPLRQPREGDVWGQEAISKRVCGSVTCLLTSNGALFPKGQKL